MKEDTSENKVKGDAQKGIKQETLPENVTLEPQDAEHMHLKLIQDNPALVKVYLPVSDDEGQLLGDMELEGQVKAFCEQYKATSTLEAPDEVIEEAKKLANRYTLKINVVENSISGTITKYRIRQGMLFIILKELVRKKMINWTEWFKANFDKREFRSVQDYMNLARIENIIRYAFLGKERLLNLRKQLSADQKKQDDPIGAFLEENGIDFNPADEPDERRLRIEADVAINLQKLLKEGINEVPKELVETLVRNGRELEKSHIEELKRAQQVPDQDVVEYMKSILDSNGKPEPIMTSERKAEGFKKTADRFLKAVGNALEDRDYVLKLDRGTYDRLIKSVTELEQFIPTN